MMALQVIQEVRRLPANVNYTKLNEMREEVMDANLTVISELRKLHGEDSVTLEGPTRVNIILLGGYLAIEANTLIRVDTNRIKVQ